jgi:hypothetical protein
MADLPLHELSLTALAASKHGKSFLRLHVIICLGPRMPLGTATTTGNHPAGMGYRADTRWEPVTALDHGLAHCFQTGPGFGRCNLGAQMGKSR